MNWWEMPGWLHPSFILGIDADCLMAMVDLYQLFDSVYLLYPTPVEKIVDVAWSYLLIA